MQDSVRGIFVLFDQIEFNRLLRKPNLKIAGHAGIWKYIIKQTFNNAVEQLMNNDFAYSDNCNVTRLDDCLLAIIIDLVFV